MAIVCALVVLRARSLARLDHFLPVLLNNNRKQSVRSLSISRYYSTIDNVPKTKDLNDTDLTEKPQKKVEETTDLRKDLNDTDVTEKPQKKIEEIKITLLLPDNSLMVTDLENANKISKRRGLLLIKVEEIKAKTRPVYKLINQTEHLKHELGDEENEEEKEIVFKSIKTVQISSKITLHDLNTKLKNVNKLLEKKHKIKLILVHGSAIQDRIVKSIETSTKNLATIQKIVKSSSTIFTMKPISSGLDNNKLENVDKNKKR